MRVLHLLSYFVLPVALVASWVAPPRIAPIHPDVAFDADRALVDVFSIAEGCSERVAGSPCHQRTLAFTREALAKAGARVSEQSFQGGTNILAEQRGSRPGVVVLTAHHDTVPRSPGALDDAAGVAVVIEIARALRKWDFPRRTVRYAIFDREEEGLLGSQAYLASLSPEAVADIDAAIAVEMPGFHRGSPVLHTFQQPVIPPADLVRRVLTAAPVLDAGDPFLFWMYPLVTRTTRIPFGSDDASFRAAGVPAAFVSDASFSRFYEHYHQPTDLPSEVDGTALERTGDAVLRIVADLSAGPRIDRDPRTWLPLGRNVVGHNMLVLFVLLGLLPLVTSPAGYGRVGGFLLAGAAALATYVDPVVALVVVTPMAYASSLGFARFLGLLPTVGYFALLYAAQERIGVPLPYEGGAVRALVVVVAAIGLAARRMPTEHRRVAFPRATGTTAR